MKPSKSCLRSLTRDTRLRLKEHVYWNLKNRGLFFNRVGDETVYLLDESGVFGMAVKVDSIDWSNVCS
jgi:hypothetical protein